MSSLLPTEDEIRRAADEVRRNRHESRVAEVRNIATARSREEAPDRAEALKIEKTRGIPFDTAERNLPELRASETAQALAAQAERSSSTADLLSSPAGPLLAAQPGQVALIQDAGRGLTQFWDAPPPETAERGFLSDYYRRGNEMVDGGSLAFNVGILGRTGSPQDMIKLDQHLWEPFVPEQVEGLWLLDDLAGEVITQLPIMRSITTFTVAGAGIGAGVGLLGGPGGVVAGLKTGRAVGTFTGSLVVEGGNLWMELTRRAREIEERTGEVIDPDAIRGASLVGGAGIAGLEVIGIGRLARYVPGYGRLKAKFTGEAIEILLTNPGMRARLSRLGRRVAGSAGTEGMVEALQTALQQLTGESLVALFTDEPFDLFNWDNATEIVWSAAIGGVVGPVYTTVLGAPAEGLNAALENNYAKKRLEKLGLAADQSMGELGQQLRETNPELYREWQARLIEEAGGDPNLYINAKKLNELFQSEDVDAEALAQALPEVFEQLPEAMAIGANVVIPLADYLTHLPEHHEALGQDVRFALTAPSAAEAEASESDIEAALNETMEELAEVDRGGEELSPGEGVEQQFLKQLIESGAASPEVARPLAGLLRMFVERLEGRGVGEQAFDFGLDVEGPLADELRPTLEQALEKLDYGVLLDEIRGGLEPELKGLPMYPLLSKLKSFNDGQKMRGGVDPDSELAGELRHAGLTQDMLPGIFRRGPGSYTSRDSLLEVLGEQGTETFYALIARGVDRQEDRQGGVELDAQQILDAVTEELQGFPLRTEEQLEQIRERRQPRDELAAVLDQLGLDLDELGNEEVISTLMDRYGTTLEQSDVIPPDIEDALQRAAPEDIEKENKRLEKLVGEFPGLANILPLLTGSERAKVKKNGLARMLEVFEHLDPEELATVAYSGKAKRGWYRASAQAILDVFGLEDAPRFTALLASMSPQTSVENNLINALNVWVNWDKAGRPAGSKESQKKGKDKWVSPEILEIMGASVQGTKGVKSVLDAWRQNSIRALSAETSADMELDLTISGPKVNSFMLNLNSMVNEVTLDAWMANYGLMSQEMLAGTGMNVAETEPGKGSAYLAFSAVVRRAADVLTERTGELWTPAEVQETVWSWAKVLYEKASTAGEDRTAREILAAADLTAEDISDTPDFATLFAGGIYRKILEGAQLGEGIRDTQEGRGVPVAERGDEGPVTQAEGSGIAQDAFERHLASAADRLDALRADRERDRAANQGLALSEENLRGLGLLNAQGSLGLPGDGAKPVPVEQLHKGARVPASAQRSIYRALGLAATKGQDTNESLRIYPLQTVFGETVEEVEAQLAQWLERVGWNYRVFGPHAGENGKAFYPDFSDPETPSYENSRTVWIYDPSESEGSFMDHAYTLAWRVTHEVAHGIANEQMTEKYGARGRRAGALGIIAKGPHRKPEAPLTLADGMRAVEWEHVTFLEQRRILEEDFGIEITDEEFLKENSVNLAGAVQRVLTGQFGDPGDLGVGAVALDSDVLLATAFDILKVASFQITGDIAQTFPEQESPVFGKKTGIELTGEYRKRRTALLKAQAAPATLEQAQGADRVVRGSLTYDPELLNIVMRFTEAKNLSTGLHEMGHLFFVMMLRAVEQGTADEGLVSDIQKAMSFLGVESLEAIGTEQHETWARAWEAYLYEGKAPSAELQSLFQRFSQWMIQVYKSIRKLDVELTPEIREVFDRMLATEEQIEGIQAQERMAPAFKAPHTGVMTQAEFKALQDAYGRAQGQANEQVMKKLMRELERELSEQWKSDRKRMREQVETDINSQPVYQLRNYLQFRTLLNEDDPEGFVALRLDRKALVSKYGRSILKVLGGSGQYSMWQAEGGLHPDALARMFRFSSGDALVRALADSQNRKVAIEQETDRRMKETYGDILNDGTLTEMAQDALESDAKGNYLIRELRILSRASGKPDTPQAVAKQIARRQINGKRVRDLRPNLYREAEARAAREMLQAVEDEDWEAAHAAGLQRLLNHFLIVEATKAKEKMERGRAYALTFDKKTTQQRIGKAEGGYLEEILSLLHRFDFRRMSDKEADRRRAKVIHSRPTLQEWIKTVEEEDATAGVVIDERLRDEGFATPWRNLRVDEFDAVIDAVKNIEHLARLKNKLLLAKDKRTLADNVERAVETISNNSRTSGEISKEPRRAEERVKNAIGHTFASHRKLASLLKEMDGGAGGVMFDLIIRTMDERGTFETVEREKAWEALSEIFAPFSDYGSSVRRTLTAATLGKVPMFHGELESKGMVEGLGEELSLQGRIVAVLNMGNAGNKQRLKDGYDWSPEQMQAIIDSLTKEQFQFVQKLLTFIGSYRKMAFDKEKRVTGVRPEAVEATPITHSVHGEIPGGYFPIAGDTLQGDKQSLANAAKDAARSTLRGAVVRAITRNGHLKERAEMVKGTKIRLDLGVAFEHIDNVIHDVAWHEWLIDTNKIMAHGDVQKAIMEGFGEPVYAQIRSALEDIAAGDVPAQKGWEQAVNHLRKGSSIAGMGWNVMTGAIQPLGITQSMVRIGPKWVAKGISRWLRGAATMEHTVRWIYAMSPMMANRATTMQREIREVQQKTLKGGAFDPVKDSYFFFIVKMQQVVDVPTWLGAYEKEMDASGDEARAVSMADRAVIDSQGGGQIQDLARIQRGGPLLKAWTNFYSFFNTTLNLTAESYRGTDFTSPKDVGRFAVDMLLLHTVPLLLGKLMADAIRQSWDEDESWAEYIGWAHVAWFGNLFVGARELTGAAEGYYGYSGPAGVRGFEAMSSMFGQMAQGEADQALMHSTINTMGVVLHLPAVEIMRAIEGGQALAEGTATSPHVLFTGPPKKQ